MILLSGYAPFINSGSNLSINPKANYSLNIFYRRYSCGAISILFETKYKLWHHHKMAHIRRYLCKMITIVYNKFLTPKNMESNH